MGKSQPMQCLLSFQVSLLNRTKEGAPEKHPAGEEASGEEDTQVWAKAMRPLKQPNKALETLWVSVERRRENKTPVTGVWEYIASRDSESRNIWVKKAQGGLAGLDDC